MAIVEEAGSIVVRSSGQGWQVLLVTARQDPRLWIFPKGHIEPGETAEQAALREAKEEAGVRGRVVAPIGSTAFELGPDSIRVCYFLVVTQEQGSAQEGRTLRWCSFDDAIVRVSFDDARLVLRQAREHIAQAGPYFSLEGNSDKK